MSEPTTASVAAAIATLNDAVHNKRISLAAAEQIRKWLTEPWYAEYQSQVAQLIDTHEFRTLEDVFWQPLPFGTAGRRGRMFPVGCHAVNRRTIGETVQALADYFGESAHPSGDQTPLACAVGYDPRHQSREFAEWSAEIMAAAGFRVYFLNECRATPLLAFTVVTRQCCCGIMISASHNPPQDNAIKVFGSHGGQIRDPLDRQLADRITQVRTIRFIPFEQAVQTKQIVFCQTEMDRAFLKRVLHCSTYTLPNKSRSLRILFSPLHGVGMTSVVPVLQAAGFHDLTIHPEQSRWDADFTHVPGQVANPENPMIFEPLMKMAQDRDLILASDPDADRIGAVVRRRVDGHAWQFLNGHQLAILLAEYLLKVRHTHQTLTPNHYLIKTRVTTPLLDQICQAYGVELVGDCLTGFKWIAAAIDRRGPERFVMGCEEAHGYLIGDYIRDKDAAGAALILAEFAQAAKNSDRTLWDELRTIWLRHGCHAEHSFALTWPGADGIQRMNQVMLKLRSSATERLVGRSVAAFFDYASNRLYQPGTPPLPLAGPTGNLLVWEFHPFGHPQSVETRLSLAIRPSGTEPKLKFYLFGSEPPMPAERLDESQSRLHAALVDLANDMRQVVESISC